MARLVDGKIDNVIHLVPNEIGDGMRLDPDRILEEAKGNNFHRLVIIGERDDGEIYVAGSASAGETMILLALAEKRIVFGE